MDSLHTIDKLLPSQVGVTVDHLSAAGLTDQEGLTVELQNWAAAEWIALTRSAKRQIHFKGLDEATVWPSIRQELLTRHRSVWGPYSEV